jgi:two-component system phosphate regulon sensor histidine kinase PhoR
MKVNPSTKRHISKLALRLALFSTVILTLVSGTSLYFFSEGTLWQVLKYALITLPVSFIVIYTCSHAIFYHRIEQIIRVTKNIAKKRFEDYENLTPTHSDELDYLMKQSVRASKTVEKELQRLNKIENYRKEFIGDISHELKTPIFAIQGFVETLLNGALHDEEVNEIFLKKTMRNVNRLIFLTKDLMEIAKLETGELKSNIQDIYLRDLVLDVAESLQYKSQKEEVDVVVADFDKNIMISADRNQIKQVLINLVENGIKYNKAGGRVEVGIKNYTKDTSRILVYVADNGIGIDPKDLKRVTERFFRVDKSRSREKGGTGLGLSIVKHIIEAHGEKLYIESTPNTGTTFSFTLSRVNHISS